MTQLLMFKRKTSRHHLLIDGNNLQFEEKETLGEFFCVWDRSVWNEKLVLVIFQSRRELSFFSFFLIGGIYFKKYSVTITNQPTFVLFVCLKIAFVITTCLAYLSLRYFSIFRLEF